MTIFPAFNIELVKASPRQFRSYNPSGFLKLEYADGAVCRGEKVMRYVVTVLDANGVQQLHKRLNEQFVRQVVCRVDDPTLAFPVCAFKFNVAPQRLTEKNVRFPCPKATNVGMNSFLAKKKLPLRREHFRELKAEFHGTTSAPS
jgi:hypothetical protein